MLITQTVERKISTHEAEQAEKNKLIVMTFNADDILTYLEYRTQGYEGHYDFFFLLKEDFIGSMFEEDGSTEMLAIILDIKTSEEVKMLDVEERQAFFDATLDELKKETNGDNNRLRYNMVNEFFKCEVIRVSLIGMIEFFLHKEGIELTSKHKLANQVLKSLHVKKLLSERVETLLDSIYEDSEDYEVYDKPYVTVATLLEETESIREFLDKVVFKPEGTIQ